MSKINDFISITQPTTFDINIFEKKEGDIKWVKILEERIISSSINNIRATIKEVYTNLVAINKDQGIKNRIQARVRLTEEKDSAIIELEIE